MTMHKYKVALKGNSDTITYKGRVDVYATTTFAAANKVRAMIADGTITIEVDMDVGVERIEKGDKVRTYSVPLLGTDTAHYEGRIEVQADSVDSAIAQVKLMVDNGDVDMFGMSMAESEQVISIDDGERVELVDEDE